MNLIEFIKINLLNFNLQNLIIFIICNLVLTLFLVKIWSSNKFSKKYSGSQRIHEGEVPRLSGFVMFISLLVFYLINDLDVLTKYKILTFLITPFLFVTFVEDIYQNVSFKIRLLFMALTVLTICTFWIESFPIINNIPILSKILEVEIFAILFFCFALIGIMNGVNFIDGMNGLAALTSLSALSACIHLSFIVNDGQAFMALIPWVIMMFLFFLFNYPFGKIFLGDSGAYLVGILLGIWLIDFFAKHNQISSWNALLILFYPAIEVIYSVIRKIFQRKSPFYPDRDHLHIKIFDIINKSTKKPLYSNSVTTIFLGIFWLAPALMVQFVYNSQLSIFVSLGLLSFSYLLVNIYTPSADSY